MLQPKHLAGMMLCTVCLFPGKLVNAQAHRELAVPVVSSVLEDLDGSVLGARPMQIESSPRGGLIATDWGDFSVREISLAGDVLWRTGRRGQGPGEFLLFLDLEVDQQGHIRILDPRNRRITLLDGTGSLIETVPLPPSREPAALLPRSFDPGHQTVMWHTNKRDTLWSSFSTTNRLSRHASMPDSIGALFEHPLEGEGWAANGPDGDVVIYFRWSSKMILLDDNGGVRSVVEGIEQVPFPGTTYIERTIPDRGSIRGFKIDPQAIPAAKSVAVGPSRFFVLFRGSTANAGRLVDTYALSDGVYLGSYLLPHRAEAIAYLADGRLAVLENNFIPTVRLLELPEAPELQ
ncbi:MAG: hypothetical protein OXH51_03515 [Gemmatimonadetes bacterium]|nr:hypothetical protein [Gemmatimonadota bacterium]